MLRFMSTVSLTTLLPQLMLPARSDSSKQSMNLILYRRCGYGCLWGIPAVRNRHLTAPATVRLSRTYFNNPGRDIIFLWTVLLLAGLISLIVEFMRLKSSICPVDDPASIHWASTGGKRGGRFQYGSNCGIACTPDNGPVSPLRLKAANNIYVIPVPHQLSFNATTLIAAACCIPAILSLVSMWIKILDDNWEKFSNGKPKQKPDEPILGTNGATITHMNGITNKISKWLALIEIPVFAAAVLAIRLLFMVVQNHPLI